LNVVQGVAGLFVSGPIALMCGALGLLVPAGMLVYLLLPGIRKAFGLQ
jgi:hypothetical protein